MLTILNVLALTLCSCCGRLVYHQSCSVGWAGACSYQVRAHEHFPGDSQGMRGRLISDEGDRWSVNLDWSLGFCFPGQRCDFGCQGRCCPSGRVVGCCLAPGLPRTTFIPAALPPLPSHNVFLRLRAPFARTGRYRKMPLAHAGRVVGMLDGLQGADPGYFML